MAHFYEYLEFNSDEDRENQLEVYVDVKLEPQTEDKLKALAVQGDYLILAEPHCPDCVEVVAYFQRMAKLNPNIKVSYISQKQSQERQYFESEAQQQTVVSAQKMPSIFDISGGKTELVLSEFPQFLKNQIAENPKLSETLIADFRRGKLGKEVEAELLGILTK